MLSRRKTENAFHICVSLGFSRSDIDGDIKICYNFISIQLIHKNHMFNIKVPALLPYPFDSPLLLVSLRLSPASARNKQILTFCFYSIDRKKEYTTTTWIFHMFFLFSLWNCFYFSRERDREGGDDCFLMMFGVPIWFLLALPSVRGDPLCRNIYSPRSFDLKPYK